MVFAIFGCIATANAQIIITPQLDLDPNSSSYDITATPNSTIYPGNYELNMKLSVMVNTFQTGRFYTDSYKRTRTWNNSSQTWGAWGAWGSFVPNMNIFPNLGPGQTPSSTYNGTAKTTQFEGTQIEYYVKVRFVALDGTEKTTNTPTRTATINGVPNACFSMYNIVSSQSEPSYYGPMTVNNICQYAVSINGSCSKFENAYHIRVAEFNLTNWSFVQDLYSGWAGSGEAPSFISINQLVSNNGFSFQAGKVYGISLSVGPVWHSAPIQFFRVLTTCREAGEGEIKELEMVNSTEFKLYPNPVKDELTLNVNQGENLVSYSILDITGKIVKEASFNTKSNQQNVSLNDLEKGIYLIKVVSDKQTFTEKIVKE